MIDLYPPTSKFATRGNGNGVFTPKACTPTAHGPGTPEKIAVLTERVKNRQELWHPADAIVGRKTLNRAWHWSSVMTKKQPRKNKLFKRIRRLKSTRIG